MAKPRRARATADPAAERDVGIARMFLRIALDPPLDPGPEREAAIRERNETLEACDAGGLRRITLEHRRHPATQHALRVLNRINNRRY